MDHQRSYGRVRSSQPRKMPKFGLLQFQVYLCVRPKKGFNRGVLINYQGFLFSSLSHPALVIPSSKKKVDSRALQKLCFNPCFCGSRPRTAKEDAEADGLYEFQSLYSGSRPRTSQYPADGDGIILSPSTHHIYMLQSHTKYYDNFSLQYSFRK